MLNQMMPLLHLVMLDPELLSSAALSEQHLLGTHLPTNSEPHFLIFEPMCVEGCALNVLHDHVQAALWTKASLELAFHIRMVKRFFRIVT